MATQNSLSYKTEFRWFHSFGSQQQQNILWSAQTMFILIVSELKLHVV